MPSSFVFKRMPTAEPAPVRRRHSAAAETPTKVVKKLVPGQAGTLRLVEQYGDALVCVRHRHDEHELYRWTTVELVVDQQPIRGGSDPYLWVRIARDEHDLQKAVRQTGGRCSPTGDDWQVRRSVVRTLGLGHRVRGPVRPKK